MEMIKQYKELFNFQIGNILEKSVRDIVFEPNSVNTLYKLRDIIDMNLFRLDSCSVYHVDVVNDDGWRIKVRVISKLNSEEVYIVRFDENTVIIEK